MVLLGTAACLKRISLYQANSKGLRGASDDHPQQWDACFIRMLWVWSLAGFRVFVELGGGSIAALQHDRAES